MSVETTFRWSRPIKGGMGERTRRPRAIVVGVGTIGRVHIDALRRNNVEVVSVVASTAARGVEAAEEFGIPRGDPDLATAIGEAGADVVHICAPNDRHYGMAREALTAGKHVVCEKPLTLVPEDAADLRSRAAAAGLVNAVCFNNRFYPLVQEVAARRQSNGMGRVFMVRASIVDDSLWAESDSDWRLDPATGGQSLVTSTTGSHLLDLTSFVTGSRVAAICADFGVMYPGRGTPDGVGGEEIANILVRYESGALGALSLSSMAAGHPYRVKFELDASEYGVSWDSERPNELWIGHRDKPNEVVIPDGRQMSAGSERYLDMPGSYREGFSDTFRMFFSRVYRDIARRPEERGEADYPTFAAGHAGLIVHEAIMESVRRGRWTDVDWGALAI